MSTRSAAKRQMRVTRSSDSARPSTSVRVARNAPSAAANGRLGTEKSSTKASEKPARKRPLAEQADVSESKEAGGAREEEKRVRKRRRSLPEEETKGGEEDADEEEEETKGGEEEKDKEDQEEDDEDKDGRPRTRVNVQADADFVRALAAVQDRMASAPLKMVVWDEIAQGRFRNGRGAKARLEWLQQVRRDRHHVEHAKLTEEMKTVLETLAKNKEKAREAPTSTGRASPKKRQKIGFTDPSRVRRLRRQAQLAEAAAAEQAEAPSPKETSPSDAKLVSAKAPPARETSPSDAKSASGKAHPLDAHEEERIMEMMLEQAPLFATAPRKLDVWIAIASASGGRFALPSSARNHYTWLARCLRDPNHRMAREATPRLRDMMKQFAMHKASSPGRGAPAATTDKAPPPSQEDILPQVEPEAYQEEKTPDNEEKEEEPMVDSAADERFVRLMLKKMWAFDDDNDKNIERWHKIASGIQPPHPIITNGEEAKARLAWLLRVRDNATHGEHSKLSASLRKMLVDYAAAQKTVTQVVPSPPTSPQQPSLTSEPTEREAPVGEDESDDQEPEEESAQSEEAVEEITKAQRTAQDPKRPRPSQVDVDRDEHLLKLMLDLRPFDADRTIRGSVWAKLVETLDNPKITTGIAAHSRVRWLLNVYQQSSSPDHAHLSDALRKMLKEYESINDAARAEELAQVLLVRVDASDDDEDPDQGNADPVNDLLLREILRRRPFHAKIGTGMAVWKQVASTVNRAAGAKIYPTGQSCLSHMKKLLAAARNTTTKSEVYVSKKQRATLRFIDALLKVRWPTGKTDLTEDHRACLDKIQRLLDGAPDLVIPSVRTKATKPPSAKPKPPSAKTTRAPVQSQFTYDRLLSPAPGVDSIDVLQQEIADFRNTATRDRASRDKAIARVKQQIASCREQLQAQLDEHDKERREQRDEARTLMELLKSEREMHAREAGLLLQVIQKERDDRRHEVVTLMDLVSRAVVHGRREPKAPLPAPPTA